MCDVLTDLTRMDVDVFVDDLRNFAAHQYDDLDPRRVWRTVTKDVPALHDYLTDVVLPGMDA